MPAATASRVDVGPYSVPVSDTGSGPALVYFHSFEGPINDAIAELFGNGRRVVQPTHPGFAGTETPGALQDIYNVALLYEGLLEALSISSADVIGHSLGAMFACELAAVAPGRVRSLTLVSPLGIWNDEHPAPDVLSAGGSYLTRMLWADPEHPAVQGAVSPLERATNLAASGHYMWPLPDRGLRDRAYRVNSPVHLIRGDSDGLVGEAQFGDWTTVFPAASVHGVESAGHFPMLEQPERFGAIMAGLLSH